MGQGLGAQLASLAHRSPVPGVDRTALVNLAWIAGMMVYEAQSRRPALNETFERMPMAARFACYFVVVYSTLYCSLGPAKQFIYFQF
jgi:hypothetical protein